jgi:hypothetical protein
MAVVKEELRSRFLREIVDTAPEVLEKLRDDVLPEYIKAYNIARPPDVKGDQAIVLFRWSPSLRGTIVSWAKGVRLLHNGKPPDWILAQVDETLQVWIRHPEWFVKRLSWGYTGGYRMERRPPDISIVELPTFKWDWEGDFEDKKSAKLRIMEAVCEIVDTRLEEIERDLKSLPRVPHTRSPERFTWTVLHQVRGNSLKVIAAQWNVSAATVKNVVTKLKKELEIGLPKGRPKRK